MRKTRVLLLSFASIFFLVARADEFRFPLKSGSVRFAAIGDMGTGDAAQYEVAQRMVAARQNFPFEFVIMLGDNIYGGSVFIAAHAETISQVAHTNIAAGDASGLFKALSNLGVTEEGLKVLEHDIEADEQDGKPSLGQKTMGWLKDISKYLGTEGVKVGVEVAKRAATKWIMQHYGLDV